MKARFEVNFSQENILSGDAVQCLGLLQRINSIESKTEDELQTEFPAMLPEYKIQFAVNATSLSKKKVVEKQRNAF